MTDDQQRRDAAEIERSRPGWMVMWGCYSRLFWAFPRFHAPPGTIISAPDQARLLADLDDAESQARSHPSAADWPGPSAQPVPPPARGSTAFPHRPSRVQAQRASLAWPAPTRRPPAPPPADGAGDTYADSPYPDDPNADDFYPDGPDADDFYDLGPYEFGPHHRPWQA
jgi:hypothetical protein